MSASITDDLKQELEQSGGLDKGTVRAFLTKRGILLETEEFDDLFYFFTSFFVCPSLFLLVLAPTDSVQGA